MATDDLSRLVQVDPRTVWANEALDFTPWLLANADVLAQALRIDIEITDSEHRVGRFAVDLIGMDLTNNCVLIVENQLEPTDHGHLGQLVTYAAGTDAKTVVWIAPKVREEHRDAIAFLNDLGGEAVRFFAIELSAVRIAGSPVAPLLDVVAEPNGWHAAVSKAARSAVSSSTLSESYVVFWDALRAAIRDRHPTWTNSQSTITSSWFDMPCPFKGGTHYGVSFARGGQIRSELYVDSPHPTQVDALYAVLHARRDTIEHTFGDVLTWEELPERRASRITSYGVGDVSRHEDHGTIIDWMIDHQERLRTAIDAIVPEVVAELAN